MALTSPPSTFTSCGQMDASRTPALHGNLEIESNPSPPSLYSLPLYELMTFDLVFPQTPDVAMMMTTQGVTERHFQNPWKQMPGKVFVWCVPSLKTSSDVLLLRAS